MVAGVATYKGWPAIATLATILSVAVAGARKAVDKDWFGIADAIKAKGVPFIKRDDPNGVTYKTRRDGTITRINNDGSMVVVPGPDRDGNINVEIWNSKGVFSNRYTVQVLGDPEGDASYIAMPETKDNPDGTLTVFGEGYQLTVDPRTGQGSISLKPGYVKVDQRTGLGSIGKGTFIDNDIGLKAARRGIHCQARG